jgi:hypothetical protein
MPSSGMWRRENLKSYIFWELKKSKIERQSKILRFISDNDNSSAVTDEPFGLLTPSSGTGTIGQLGGEVPSELSLTPPQETKLNLRMKS